VIRQDKLLKIAFSNSLDNFCIYDYDDKENKRNLILIEKTNNSWTMKSNELCSI